MAASVGARGQQGDMDTGVADFTTIEAAASVAAIIHLATAMTMAEGPDLEGHQRDELKDSAIAAVARSSHALYANSSAKASVVMESSARSVMRQRIRIDARICAYITSRDFARRFFFFFYLEFYGIGI